MEREGRTGGRKRACDGVGNIACNRAAANSDVCKAAAVCWTCIN